MRRNSRAGLTLIEVLIAVTLLSLLSAGILTAMRLGLSTMDRTDARMVRNRRVTSARRIIESEISGLMAVMAIKSSGPATNLSVLFLQAEPSTMRFVTAFSLEDAWRGRPQIAALQVIPGENGEGVRLVVNEIPYTGPTQAGQFVTGLETDGLGRMVPHFAPVTTGAQSFIVADRLKFCRFTYMERRLTPPFEVWRNTWGIPGLPGGVRIEMASLDESPAELHASTVTVPLNVNLTPGQHYGD